MLATNCRIITLSILFLGIVSVSTVKSQETFTGTIVSYGSGLNTRVSTGSFTLRINRFTDDERAQRLLGLLQAGADEQLVNELDKGDVGTFSINGRIGPHIGVARESRVNGKRRIFCVFRRWMRFGEIRGGYRSTDYPYSVIEIYVDPSSGKGDGTFIAAAKIRWQPDKRSGQNQVEIEDFSTFPARLMGVTERGGRGR